MKRIALLSIMMLIALCSQAQIYSSEAYFYIPAGENLNSGSDFTIIVFKGNQLLNTSGSKLRVKRYLRDDINRYEKLKLDPYYGTIYTYNSSLSTNYEYVYTRYVAEYTDSFYPWTRHPSVSSKLIFNKDNSTLVRMSKHGDGDWDKSYYIRIPKSEIISPGLNNGFIE